jgi:hypothetical protein
MVVQHRLEGALLLRLPRSWKENRGEGVSERFEVLPRIQPWHSETKKGRVIVVDVLNPSPKRDPPHGF